MQFQRQLRHSRVEQGQRVACMLCAHVGTELNTGCGVEILQHKTIRVVSHQSEQFARPAKDEIPARRIKLSEQSSHKTAVQLEIIGSAQIDFETALTVITFSRANQHGVLELI